MSHWQFIVVTGATRGLGKAISVCLARSVQTPLHIVITGRSTEALSITKEKILSIRGSRETKCDILSADLSDMSTLSASVSTMLSIDKQLRYFRAVLINNAGSLGELKSIGSGEILSSMSNTFQFNITSSCYIASTFMKQFLNIKPTLESIVLVNISSLCAIKPFESWGVYCAGKSARDMYFRVLAEENKVDGRVRVLNYAPGPLDTDMQKEIRESLTIQNSIKNVFVDMFEQGKLVTVDQSAEKLVILIEQNTFETGAHVDYYDL